MNTFRIEEQLGRDWANELLHYDVSFPPGAQKDDKLAFVIEGDSKPRTLVTQVSDFTRHADGSIASAKAWCRLDVKALQTVTLQLKPVASPDHPDRPFWHEGKDCIEVGNSVMAVCVPVSGTYRKTLAPGPVMAMRLGSGEWMGRGTLKASFDVIVKTRLLEQGPLFVRWESSMLYERATLARFECTLYAGEDIVRVQESTSYDSDLSYELDLYPNFMPDRFLIMGGGHCGNDNCIRTLDYGRDEDLGIVDWHSGHHQMSLSWMGVYRYGAEPFIGVIELDGGGWTNLAKNRIFMGVRPPESLVMSIPLPGGRKTYALVCCRADLNVCQVAGKKYNHFNEIHTRWAEVPFQKVKDWVLKWEDNEQRPCLHCSSDGIAKTRAMLKANADMRRPYDAWRKGLAMKEDPKAVSPEITGYERMVFEAMARAVVPTSTPSARAAMWIAIGDEEQARLAACEMDSAIQKTVDRIWDQGTMMDLIMFDGRHMKLWLNAYDVLKSGGFITADQDVRIKRNLAFLAYCFADPEYFPQQANMLDHNDPDGFYNGLGQRIGDVVCPPNFHTEYYSTYGIAGCCFRSHPQAAAWRKLAMEMFDRQLELHYYEGGAYCESPNYHSHSFTMLAMLANALRLAGERDFFQHPRFKAQFEHFIRIQTPPILLNKTARDMIALPWRQVDYDRERVAMMPGNGNTGNNCSDQALPLELGMGGAIYRDTDPSLSRRCMTTWRRAGRPCSSWQNDLPFLLTIDPELPGDEKLDLHSEVRTGQFVTLRGKPETEDEVYVLVKNGTATHHMDFDDGGFTIWAYGSPIAGDYGYHTMHHGRLLGGGSTWNHNCVEFDGKDSGFLGIEQTLPPEAFVSSELADLLISYIPITNLVVGPTHMDRMPVNRIEYRRYTLFVKPHYMIVLDSILACDVSQKWWLHAQASDIQIEGPRVRFVGKFGVDLLAQFITPRHPQIHTGEHGVMKHVYAQQMGAKDWRAFVAPVKPGQDFSVTPACSGRVINVSCDQYKDTVFLSHYPFAFEEGNIRFHGRAGVVRTYADGRREARLLDGEKLEIQEKR